MSESRNAWPSEEEIERVLKEGSIFEVGDMLGRTASMEPRVKARYNELVREQKKARGT